MAEVPLTLDKYLAEFRVVLLDMKANMGELAQTSTNSSKALGKRMEELEALIQQLESNRTQSSTEHGMAGKAQATGKLSEEGVSNG